MCIDEGEVIQNRYELPQCFYILCLRVVVRIYSFADRHANNLFLVLLIPLIFSFFLRSTFGLFLLFFFPFVLLSRITHNLFSLSLRYQITDCDCVASELSPIDRAFGFISKFE